MNANDLFNAVMQLDLEPIKTKLMHVESGEGWSLEKANAVEKEYRRFLCLMKMYPDEDTAPLVDVDTFWHYHILDTMKYAADCEQVFGYFLHHYPYVGMRSDEDEQFRLDSGNRMRELYEATFGDAYPGTEATSVTATRGALGNETAWCAGPHIDELAPSASKAINASTAWCAGPHIDKLTRRAIDTITNGTAWCAGPHIDYRIKRASDAIGTGTAWCAGPHGQDLAFCASPHTRADGTRRDTALKADTAFCASPHGKETAFCASPHVTGEAAANA